MVKITRMVSTDEGTVLRNSYHLAVDAAAAEAMTIHSNEFKKIWHKVDGIHGVSRVVAWTPEPGRVVMFEFEVPVEDMRKFDELFRQRMFE